MGARRTMNGIESKITKESDISESLAIGLVECMRSKNFYTHARNNKYLVLMHDRKLYWMNDISFLTLDLPFFSTIEILEAISKGKIGELIQRKIKDYEIKYN